MKRLAFSLLLSLSISPLTFALALVDQVGPLAPQWEEFCPVQYCNVTPDSIEAFMKNRKSGLVGNVALSVITLNPFIGLTRANSRASKKNAIVNEMIYWMSRHHNFDNEINTCKTTNDVSTCYMTIRQIETYKTSSVELSRTIKQAATIIRPTTQTNCQTYGNTTHCNSY